MWENIARRLEGSLVVLEPLEPRHEQGLFEAAQDPRIWQYIPFDVAGPITRPRPAKVFVP